jgi:hypothetical protein
VAGDDDDSVVAAVEAFAFGLELGRDGGRGLPPSDVDVVQVVVYETWRSRARYDPELSQRASILGIVRKRTIDHVRDRRHPVTSADLITPNMM